MGFLDEIMSQMKKQPGKHYRLIRLDSANVSVKKAKGYDLVNPSDPEVKGTALEKQAHSDGTVRVGNLALARTSKENAKRLRAQIDEKTDRRLKAIKRKFLKEGEQIKRALGPQHGDLKFIAKEE